MHPQFSELTPAGSMGLCGCTGSIGDFRYRFCHGQRRWSAATAVYTVYCFEAANDVQQQDFPWDDQGVEQLKAWLQERYDHYVQEGSL